MVYDMKQNKPIVYVAKIYDWGLCYCGKRGCGLSAYIDRTKRHVTNRNREYANEIEFTCIGGHRNRLKI